MEGDVSSTTGVSLCPGNTRSGVSASPWERSEQVEVTAQHGLSRRHYSNKN